MSSHMAFHLFSFLHTISLAKKIHTITDGDLMLEVNALKDKFCITFQLINKDPRPLELFCEVLKQENIPYSVSERQTRYMPKIKLP